MLSVNKQNSGLVIFKITYKLQIRYKGSLRKSSLGITEKKHILIIKSEVETIDFI